MISRRALVAGSGALLLPKRARAVVMIPSTPNMAFPGGRAPGFNPNHVALSGGGVCRFSSVNLGTGVHTNLLTGKGPDSTSGTLAQTIFSNAPFAKTTSTTQETFTTGINLATDSVFTLACIFYTTTVAAVERTFQFGTAASNNGVRITIVSGAFDLAVGGGSNTSSGLTVVANVPYFGLIGSIGTGTNQCFALLMRLDTGATTTSTFTQATANVAPTSVNIGSSASALQGGITATAYVGKGAPSLAMYQAWAADPWSFWYPNRLQDMTQ